MRFFSEFGSCWGGAMVSSAAEAGGHGWPTGPQGGNCHTHGQVTSKKLAKLRSSGRGANHWKPKLSAISENSPTSEVGRSDVRRFAGTDDGKRPVKVKLKSAAKAAPPPNHEEDYWKYSYTMALPAFSPTSYLF